MHKRSRRQFLQASGAGAGLVALGAGAGSLLWPRGRALAGPGDGALSTGAIFFVLNGGARTQAVFNGTVGLGTNPFGQLSALTVPLSKVQQGTGLDDPSVNARISLVSTCQHHNRTGNHDDGRTVACTGYGADEVKPGILTILNYAFSFRAVPCVNIGDDTPTTNIGTEISSAFAPIKIATPLDVQQIVASLSSTKVSPGEAGRLDKLRYALEDAYHRNTVYSDPETIPAFQKKAAAIAAQLDDAALDIRTDASLGQYLDGEDVDNAGLRDAFGVDADGGGNSFGAQAMLALRLRQLGCAGITLSSSQNWDLHSSEDEGLPPRAFGVGQAIAGLVAHLSRIPDPYVDGLTLLDTTVVTVLTDFNRGNWSQASGFNGSSGSDHQTDSDATALQCIPVVGGGLPGGKVLGEMGGDGSPVGASPVYETRQILATVLERVGVSPDLYLPGVEPLSKELGA